MLCEYNYDNLPIVYVTFNENITNEDDFDSFLNEWLNLYDRGQDFEFIFDTRNIKDVELKFCIKMALFIKKLKKKTYHYLRKSLILVNDNKIKRLLDFIFLLQSPVAPVIIWVTDEINENTILSLHKDVTDINLLDNMIYIKPGISYMPFII